VIGVSDGNHQNAFTAAVGDAGFFNPPLLAISIILRVILIILRRAGFARLMFWVRNHMPWPSILAIQPRIKWPVSMATRLKRVRRFYRESLAYLIVRLSYTDAGHHKIAFAPVIAVQDSNDGNPLLYNQTGNMDGSSGCTNKPIDWV